MRTMLETSKKDPEREGGFGLIEVTLVIVVLAILLAIAIPNFVGASNAARDRSPRASLRITLTAAKVIYSDTGSFLGATTAALAKSEPELKFLSKASTGPKVVRVHTATATDTMLSAQSEVGKCYFVTESTKYGPGFAVESGTCAAAKAPSVMKKPAGKGIAVTSASGKSPTWASSW